MPLLDELFQVADDVLLELGDGLGAEGVGDDLAFAGVLCSIAGAEQVASDGYKCFIEVAVEGRDRSVIRLNVGSGEVTVVDIPLGPPTGVGIDDGYSIWIGYGNMIWLDADQRPILVVGGIDGEVTSTLSGLVEKPQAGDTSQWRTGNMTQRSIA